MATSSNIVIAFDLYGTLLSTASIATKLSSIYGEDKGPGLAATWRKYQLEYTWRANSMGLYEPFSTITLRSLKHTVAEAGLKMTDPQTDDLMHAYDNLSTFPDVISALQSLKQEKGITAVVFSNGTKAMVGNSVKQSEDLSPHQGVFQDLIVVEEVKRFKPDPAVYKHLATKMGKGTDAKAMGEMWLVSGNPFDIVGARSCGMNAAWVDRTGSGWSDGLADGEAGKPNIVVKGLGEVVDAVRKHAHK